MTHPVHPLLQPLLGACVVYFVSMAAAHSVDYKVPLLFIYYDVPSVAYQDKIISFCAAVYAILFIAAAQHPRLMAPYAAAALAITTAGLAAVNRSADLASKLQPGASTAAYWAQTTMIGALTATIVFLLPRTAAVKVQ